MRALSRLFGIDARNLALFRFGLAAIFIADLSVRLQDVHAHYTDAGVFSREALAQHYARMWRWSLHVFSGEAWLPIALMLLSLVAAVCLGIGWHTRWATLLCWVLAVSVQTRSPLIINAGDTLLRLLLFWSIFLPLGQRWSLDARRRRRNSPPGEPEPQRSWHCSLATAAILIQIALLYWMTGLYKLIDSNSWNPLWLRGNGLYYSLSFDAYARPAAGWFLHHVWLLQVLNYLTLAAETAMPLLVFSPLATRRLRWFAVLLFVGLHLGIELTLTVGLFSWVSLLGWILFVPLWWPAEPPASVRTTRVWLPWLRNAAVGSALILVIVWNLSGFVRSRREAFRAGLPRVLAAPLIAAADAARSPPVKRVAEGLVLVQQWNMFARPPRRDGWLVAQAKLDDGSTCDLLRPQAPLSWEKPAAIYAESPNHRWRKYHFVLRQQNRRKYRGAYCRYLAKRYEQLHGRQVQRVDLYLMLEDTGPPGEEPHYGRMLLWRETLVSRGAFEEAFQQLDASEGMHPGI